MGRTRVAKAIARDLAAKRETSQQRKHELEKYLSNLKSSYDSGKISFSRYAEIFHTKNDGRNLGEWIQYYDRYGKECEREEEKHKRKIIRKKILTTFFSVAILSALVYFLFFTSYINLNFSFTGLAIGGNQKEFVQELNLNLTSPTTYEWQLENQGQLSSLKLTGLIEEIQGEGNVKIYLDNLLILDSSTLKETAQKNSVPGITQNVVEEIANSIDNQTIENSATDIPISNISNSEEQEVNETKVQTDSNQSSNETETQTETNQEEVNETKEDSSPSQSFGPLLPSENQTETQNETIGQTEIEILIKEFKEQCEDTCDLEALNLNKSSYTLRIEISNARLQLDTITYELVKEKVKTPIEVNETNFTEIPEVNITTEENLTITTTQYSAVLGQPVKWKKQISLNESGPATVELPKEAKNIVVNKISENSNSEEITNNGVLPKEDSSPSQGEPPTSENKEIKEKANAKIETKIKGENQDSQNEQPQTQTPAFSMTGNAVAQEPIVSNEQTTTPEGEQIIQVSIDDNSTNYEITYETPAPQAIEEEITNGKRVIVSGPETIHYENVLIFTNLNENLNIKNPSYIKIHWIEENTYISPTSVQDTDNNGIYDYVEFIAPHLSNQTFEIIIITKALHLDSNRNFISDIYEKVKELDNNWSETIPDEDYVRVTFKVPLDNTRDITIWPRTVSGTPRIEVYEIDGTTKIAEFPSINDNQYNKIYLTNLPSGYTQDTFDLRVVGGSVELDYIVDPTTTYTVNSSTSMGAWGNRDSQAFWVAATNFSAVAYGAISVYDGVRWPYAAFTASDYPFVRFNFTVNENVAQIIGLNFTIVVGDNASEIGLLRIWGNNTWLPLIVSGNNSLGSDNKMFSYNFTLLGANASNNIPIYLNTINGSVKQFTAVISGPSFDTGDGFYIDYAGLTVITDIEVPTFTSIPVNTSIFYGNNSLGGIGASVEFTASDNYGIANWTVNDTNFQISTNGTLTNKSLLSAGDYAINVTITDNVSNINFTTFRFSVNKSELACNVFFNATSPITFPEFFLARTDCTNYSATGWTLTRNGTAITNNSAIRGGAGYYNITVQRTDPGNYTNTVNSQFFTINQAPLCQVLTNETSPLTYPKFFLVWTNCTAPVTLQRNGTTITNNSAVRAGADAYNLSFSADTQNYTSYYNQTEFRIVKNTADICGVYFNTTSPQVYPEHFAVFTNCSTVYTLVQNTSTIVNYSNVTGGAGYYNLSVRRTDTTNYTSIFDQQFFTITANSSNCVVFFNTTSPITYPEFFKPRANCANWTTVAGWNLTVNGIQVANDTAPSNKSAGVHNVTIQRFDTTNYSNTTANSLFFTIAKSSQDCGIWFNVTSPQTYPNIFWAASNCINATAGGFTLTRNGTTIGNNTAIRAGAGYYNISVQRTDTANYSNTTANSLFFTVAKSAGDICQIFFNETSPLTADKTFTAWANCSTAFVLARNDTTIANATEEQDLAVGAYNFSMRRNDTANYSYIYNETVFRVITSSQQCGTLSTAYGNYTLTQNVTSVGTCFNVTAENVTLDCAGFWINYSTGGADQSGVWTNQFNTTIKNCNIVEGDQTLDTITLAGINLYGADNCTIFNNSVIVYGISEGIFLEDNGADDANFNNLTGNTATSPYHAFDIQGNNNTLTDNFGNSTSDPYEWSSGIILYTALNNTLINNTAVGKQYGLYIANGAGSNNLINNTAISYARRAIYLENGSNNLFRDCVNISGGVQDVFYDSTAGSVNNTFINCSYDINKETVLGAGNELIRKWYYKAYANYSNTTAASEVNVSAFSTDSVLNFTAQTDGTGYIPRQEIIEYINLGGTRSFYSNYTIFANKSTVTTNGTHIFNFTITQNKMDDWFTLTIAADSTPPTYSHVSTNNTLAGRITNFSINVTDETALEPNGQYIFSTNNTGSWVNNSIFGGGEKYWQKDLTINASLPVLSGSSTPAVFYKDSSWYLIAGLSDGNFYGYTWDGDEWVVNLTINASLPDIGAEVAPTVFQKDGSWYLISGADDGRFYGYTWDGDEWVVDLTINASLPDMAQAETTPNVFYKDSSWYLISGANDGGFDGFIYDDGNDHWNDDSAIINGLPVLSGLFNSPFVFEKDSSWYLISGALDGNFYGYNWDGDEWVVDLTINASLPDIGSESMPTVFQKDSSWYLISGGGSGSFYGYSYPLSSYNFTATPSWANVTAKLNSTTGTMVGYRWYLKDNAGNMASTPIYVVTTTSAPLDCGDSLNTAYGNYTLTQNVTSVGTCFNVTAANVTLDCAGFWINFSTGGAVDYGIETNQFNTTIKNCNIIDGNQSNEAVDGRAGIFFNAADNGTVYNNSVTTYNVSRGIFLKGAANFNNITSNIVYSGYFAIDIQGNNNTITNNLGNSTGTFYYWSAGIILYGATYNTLINNTVESKDYGIYLDNGANNTNAINNTVISTENYAIYLAQSSINTIFRDCVNVNGAVQDVLLSSSGGIMNSTFINCSYDTESVADAAGNELIRKWYYKAYVNYSNTSAASNVNITAYNTTGILQFTAQTDGTGYIARQEITEYNNTGGTRSFYNNYTIFANKSTVTTNGTHIFNFTITQNKMDDWFTLSPIFSLQIINPTTANPLSVNGGEGISVYFNFTQEGSNITTGVSINNVTIGGTSASIIGSSPDATPKSCGNDCSGGDYTYPSSPSCTQHILAEACTAPANCDGTESVVDLWLNGTSFASTDMVNVTMQVTCAEALLDQLKIWYYNGTSWAKIFQDNSCNYVEGTGNYSVSFTINSTSPTQYIRGQIGADDLTLDDQCYNSGNNNFGDNDDISFTVGDGQQFGYLENVGWQVNVTVPVFESGLKDLFVNATYGENTRNDTQTNAINYGAANNPPAILAVYNNTMSGDPVSGTLEGPAATYVYIIFNVSDPDGLGNINNASAKINFTSLDGIAAIRENTSCKWMVGQSTATSANFSCNITMWWWDQPGVWNISAYIADVNSNIGYNHSVKNFSVGATDGIQANITSLTWATINPGASNQEALQFIGINNTGNRYRSLYVNSSDLIGETTKTQALGANNFTVRNVAGCGGTAMVNRTDVNVTSARLWSGNYTYNNGTAQEKLYFCLATSNAELTSQSYSTTALGNWIIKVLVVAVIPRRRKKKEKQNQKETNEQKETHNNNLLKAMNLIADELNESLNKKEVIEILVEKLKKKYNLSRNEFLELINAREGITIPITIFTKELGALESLTKYMKENLNMNYREIAKELGRNERTIWTAYKKANEKQKEPIKIKETEINLPISIFESKELTILESLIVYLKEKGKKYNEIAELLNRDQRNIWTIYSRAIKKNKI